jgi:hypothetical protein
MPIVRPTRPFETICKHCGDIVRSWHGSVVNVPAGEARGLVFCGCGRTGADSSDVNDMGRVLSRDPDPRQ